uniref:Uncharacterized protein n=1 Tax=Tetraselmis chuii TaxID=63592 RepID=A0A7S1SNC9_9CHLO|mmetsp:Transcript_20494/g.36543  ORF Transcript_20494/g.36543 Transcript_20494/m.36543 type:complete len:411 (+) Transcript_20494:136-1368(+)
MLRCVALTAILVSLLSPVTSAVEPGSTEHQDIIAAVGVAVATQHFASAVQNHKNSLIKDSELLQSEDYPKIMSEIKASYRLDDQQAIDLVQPLLATFGVNGVLDAIESQNPGCHGEAHVVGRAAVRYTSNLTDLAQACGLRCHTGCFHGVALGLVVDQAGVDKDATDVTGVLTTKMSNAFRALCNDSTIIDTVGAGECLHAVGHTAAMMADEVDYEKALSICMTAYEGTPVFQHYCGTGAFMQITPEPPTACESTALPGACYMYSWRPFFRQMWHGMNYIEELTVLGIQQKEYCISKPPTAVHKAGCIYGLASHLAETVVMHDRSRVETRIKNGKKVFNELCGGLEGELLAACVEGYLLRNMKYFPKGAADEICSQWSLSWSYTREMCMEAAQLTQYSFDRNVERYVMQL